LVFDIRSRCGSESYRTNIIVSPLSPTSLVIGGFLVAGTTLPRNRNPKASYSPKTDEILVVFETDTPGSPISDIRSTVVSASLTLIVQRVNINLISHSEHHPVVSSDQAGTFFVLWNNGSETDDNDNDKRSPPMGFDNDWSSLEMHSVTNTEREIETRSTNLQASPIADLPVFSPKFKRQAGTNFIQATVLCPASAPSTTRALVTSVRTVVPYNPGNQSSGEGLSFVAIVVIILGLIIAILLGFLIYFMLIRPRIFKGPKFEILSEEMTGSVE